MLFDQTPSLPATPSRPLPRRVGLPRLALPSLGLRASERRLLLFVVDFLLLLAAVVIAIRLRTDWLPTPGAFVAVWRWWVALALTWWLVSHLLDSYDLARAASAPHSILSAAPAALLAILVYQVIPIVSPPLETRGLIVLAMALAGSSIALWRGFYAVFFVQPSFEVRALVFGAGWAGQSLAAALSALEPDGAPNPFHGTGYHIVGFVDDDPAKQAAGAVAGIPILGRSADLPQLAATLAVNEVVLAITNRETMSQEAFDALLVCREQGRRVTTMPSLYERLLGRVSVEHTGRNLHAALPIDEGNAAERLFWPCKRVMDLLVATGCLLILGLLIPLVALFNRLDTPGPLFYRQTRVGRGGRLFQVIKFRSMRADAEGGTGAVWAAADDPRITGVGRWLRKSRLDELPQVINVLRGEMSIIGPRPERPEFVDDLARQIPYYRARHAVKPGITGWAQVRYGYGNTVDDARTKLEYDLYYVRHASFYLDSLIALKTVGVMFKLQGR